ncbi:DNA-3-methyladenine glycosylase [Rhizobium sp. LjRoot254]|uniref:DNA-3-methyladenine glycosylase n=1 Tax=Rhizobium sp. LjRoot254 TaxID=3342297 RepID=UPI003ECCA3DB
MSDHKTIEPPNVEKPERLTRDFFERPPEAVARDLIGVTLLYEGVGGTIVETEAYHPGDPASHSFRGQTLRNSAMFGPAGCIYVYRIYGMHWCLNFVCLPGSAVLIRAFQPEFGMHEMLERRGDMAPRLLASGPGRLCDALGISGADDGKSLFEPPFELHANLEPKPVVVGSRIGITKAVTEPLRFGLEGSPFLSKKF